MLPLTSIAVVKVMITIIISDDGYDNASENDCDNDKNKKMTYILSYITVPFIMLTKMTAQLILSKSIINNNNK